MGSRAAPRHLPFESRDPTEPSGIWSILYVAYATDPARITVHELVNPFSKTGINRFRPSSPLS